jgi:hypothetical protein
MSLTPAGKVRSYLCDGALIGTPVGGTVPEASASTNLVADFSAWTLSGGVTYDSTANAIRLNSVAGTATSPLIRINGANTCRFRVQATATQPSPSSTPNTQAYMSSKYYGDDGVTLVYNMNNWQGNGDAQAYAPGTPYSYNWNPGCGPNVKYMRFIINSSPSNRTSDNVFTSPMVTTS